MISNVFDYCLKVFLVTCAIFYVPYSGQGDAVVHGYMVQELFFRYGVMVLCLMGMMKAPVRTLNCKYLGIFGLYLILTSVWFGFDVSLRAKVLNVFFGLLFFKTVFEHFEFSRLKEYAFWFGGLLLLNLGFCALQYHGLDPLLQAANGIQGGIQDQLVGLMRLKVNLAVLSAVFLPILALFYPVFVLAAVPLLYFGQSSAAIGALVVGFTVLAWLRLKKRLFWLVFSALLILGTCFVVFYDMPGGQFTERFKVWHGSTGIALKTNPIIGNGIGSFTKFNFQTNQIGHENLQWLWAHNEFVQGFFEFGIIGMALIIGFLRSKCRDFFLYKSDPILQMSFVTCLIILGVSFFHFPFQLARFSQFCIFFMAIYCARLQDNAK